MIGKQTVPTAVRICLKLPFSDFERCGFMDAISYKTNEKLNGSLSCSVLMQNVCGGGSVA